MEKLYIQGTKAKPTIKLDKENAVFLFEGKSLPENTDSVYLPVFKWFDDYSNEPLEETVIVFKLQYLNTSSSRMINEVFQKLYELHHSGHPVKVLWYYEEEDEEMLERGDEFKAICEIPFELIQL